jgi:Tol biopolymer transport system component
LPARPSEGAGWSPDGSSLVYASSSGLHVVTADGSATRTIAGRAYGTPTWSPDGSRIAFLAFVGGCCETILATIAPDGSGRRDVAHTNGRAGIAWSP